MAIDQKYQQGPGGFYDITNGSGPYSIDSAGAATLIGSAGGGSGGGGGLTNAELRATREGQLERSIGAVDRGLVVVGRLQGDLERRDA